MDESFMSIGSFDEESFIAECTYNTDEQTNEPHPPPKKSINITELLTKPIESKLEFDDTETPRNCSLIKRQRKRKNIARRCLSTDLNSDYSLNSQVRVFFTLLFIG